MQPNSEADFQTPKERSEERSKERSKDNDKERDENIDTKAIKAVDFFEQNICKSKTPDGKKKINPLIREHFA